MFEPKDRVVRGQFCRTVPEIMKILGNELRFEFIRSLARCPKSVKELADELGLRQPRASQELINLRAACFVTFEQQSKDRIYRLTDQVESIIETGHAYLKISSADGDAMFVRTHLPFAEAHPQKVLWPWAADACPLNGKAGIAKL